MRNLQRLVNLTVLSALFSIGAIAESGAPLEGDVKGEDGNPIRGATIKLERKDAKGSYKVKTDKNGHWRQDGLPFGTYDIVCNVKGKAVDKVSGVRNRLEWVQSVAPDGWAGVFIQAGGVGVGVAGSTGGPGLAKRPVKINFDLRRTSGANPP